MEHDEAGRGSEAEVSTEKIGARGTGVEAAAVVVQTLDEFFIEEIVHIQAHGDVLGERVACEHVKQPVTWCLSRRDNNGAKAVLRAAALTYVAAAITAVLQLLYYISIANRRR